jgi:hypothetical protein
MPAMSSAFTRCHCASSIWRASQAKRASLSDSRLFSSAGDMFNARASWRRCSGVASTCFGSAQTDGTETLEASNAPCRSVMRPRLAGSGISTA